MRYKDLGLPEPPPDTRTAEEILTPLAEACRRDGIEVPEQLREAVHAVHADRDGGEATVCACREKS